MKALLTLTKLAGMTLLLAVTSSPLWATTCPNAINIASIPVTNQALVCGAGNDLSSTTVPTVCGAASNSYKGGNEALYTFTPTTTGNYVISIAGQSWTAIFVYAGCPTSGGTCVGSIGNLDTSKSLTVSLTAGVTYFIWFDTFPSPPSPCPGTFSLDVAPPPPANDNCAGAIAFPAIPTNGSCSSVTVNTAFATGSADATCFGTEDDDVWYSFTVPVGYTSVNYSNTSISGNSDRALQIFSGSCPGTSIGCYDPETGTITGLVGGQTYLLRAYTYGTGVTSNFSICLSVPPPPPANDDCAGAIPLTVGSSCSYTQYTNAGATGSVGPPAPGCASYSGGDVWFSVVVPAGGRLIFDSNTGVLTDGGMAIYSGNCGALTLIECDDDDSANGLMPFIDRSGLTPGSTIFVRFWEYSNDNNGTFSLCVYAPLPPCNAPGTPSASNVSSTSATLSWAAAGGAISYDYSFGTAGHVCGTGSVNTAATSVNLTGLIPNTTYTFCVRTSTCGGGASSNYVSTTFTTAPLPNDACAGAQTVTCGSTINGSTVGAASDSGQGSCGSGGTPGNGVWYKLVGNGAQVTLNLCGSAYDTKVHVYSGACGSLTCVGSNDDDAVVCGSTRSRFVFNASVGVDYYILVSGFSSSTGAFSMNISCLCGPALGAPWTVTNIGASNGGAIENVCDGTIDVSATNYGSPTSDVQTYAWQTLCGNGFIKAKLNNVTNGGWGGLMFRESSAPGSRKIAIRSQLSSAVVRDLRATTNGVMQQQQFPRPNTPQWLRLTRNGNVFTGETSVDGVNWDFTFSTTLALPNCIQVGLFTQSININTTSTAVFSNIMGVALTPPVIPLVSGGNNTEVESIGFDLFPNPATDEVNIKLPSYIGKQVQIAVYNNVGQAVIVREIDEVQDAIERLPLNELATGVYFVTVRSEGVPMQTQKLIVGSPRP